MACNVAESGLPTSFVLKLMSSVGRGYSGTGPGTVIPNKSAELIKSPAPLGPGRKHVALWAKSAPGSFGKKLVRINSGREEKPNYVPFVKRGSLPIGRGDLSIDGAFRWPEITRSTHRADGPQARRLTDHYPGDSDIGNARDTEFYSGNVRITTRYGRQFSSKIVRRFMLIKKKNRGK